MCGNVRLIGCHTLTPFPREQRLSKSRECSVLVLRPVPRKVRTRSCRCQVAYIPSSLTRGDHPVVGSDRQKSRGLALPLELSNIMSLRLAAITNLPLLPCKRRSPKGHCFRFPQSREPRAKRTRLAHSLTSLRSKVRLPYNNFSLPRKKAVQRLWFLF